MQSNTISLCMCMYLYVHVYCLLFFASLCDVMRCKLTAVIPLLCTTWWLKWVSMWDSRGDFRCCPTRGWGRGVFFGYKQSVRVPVTVPVPVLFSGTNSFWDQTFPVPVSVLFSGPIFSVTGTGTFSGTKYFGTSTWTFFGSTPKMENFREFSGTGTKFPGILQYRYQYFLVPIPVLFSGTKFFRYLYFFS